MPSSPSNNLPLLYSLSQKWRTDRTISEAMNTRISFPLLLRFHLPWEDRTQPACFITDFTERILRYCLRRLFHRQTSSIDAPRLPSIEATLLAPFPLSPFGPRSPSDREAAEALVCQSCARRVVPRIGFGSGSARLLLAGDGAAIRRCTGRFGCALRGARMS